MASSGSIEPRELLSRIWIFEGVEPGELDRLEQITGSRELRRGEILFAKGAPGEQLFGVMRGRLKISASGPGGKGVVFGFAEPGEVFGEIALLDAQPRSATIEAIEPTQLLTLRRHDFLSFLESHPRVAIRLAQVLAGRVRRLSGQMEDAVLLPLPARLARQLLRLAGVYGRGTASGTRIELKLPQQRLGELVGASRESVNKLMRQWTQEGLIRVDQRIVTLTDVDALHAIADSVQG